MIIFETTTQCLYNSWNIWGDASGNSNASHIYQLILKSMKLLPYHLYTKEAMLDTTKKRNMSSNVDNDYELIGRIEPHKENGDCWSQE